METPAVTNSLRDRFGALLRTSRSVILVEVLLLILIMLLRLQSTLILLLLIGWLSLWLRRCGWQAVGLTRPASWSRTFMAALGIGALYQAFSIAILVPGLHRLTGLSLDLSQFAALRGSLSHLALWLAVSWTLAAFGEEIAFRGYALNRLADLFGDTRLGWGLSLGLSAVFFGIGHLHQGVIGVVDNVVFGAVLAGLFLTTRRNLWLPILVHGVNDTIGFLLIYFGLYP